MLEYFKDLKERFGIPLVVNSRFVRFLILLLAVDLWFMVIHFYHRITLDGPTMRHSLWSIYNDYGYSEIFQYIKEFWIVVLIFIVGVRLKKPVFFAWALLFSYLLLDDSLLVHENLGRYLVATVGIEPMFGFRAQDFGEVIVFLSFGVVLFSIIGLFYLKADETSKRVTRQLALMILALAFCGVVADMLHSLIKTGMGLIEDGGEMIIMSIILAYVFFLDEDAWSAE